MFPTVEEHQGMARAAGADRMPSTRQSPPMDSRRTSLNKYTTNGDVRHLRPTRPDPEFPLNVVYWPNRPILDDFSPLHLDPSSMTHLILSSAKVAFDGTVELSGDDDSFTGFPGAARTGCLEACRALKKGNPNLKIFASVGGDPENLGQFRTMALTTNEALSKHFGHELRLLACKHELDGIELDWSHASSIKEAESFLKLTATVEGYLRKDLQGRSFQLCVSLPASPQRLEYFQSMKDVNRLVDFITLRTFEMPVPVPNFSYHQAPVFPREPSPPQQNFQLPPEAGAQASCSSVVYALESKGANMRKLVLGIPCYGTRFFDVSGPLQSCRGREILPYRALPLPGTEQGIREDLGLAYCVGGGHGFTSYDVPETVKRKAELVKSKNMAGLCYLDGAGDQKGDRSLIRSGYFELVGAYNRRNGG